MPYRIEKDFLGEVHIDNQRYYGIHTKRAMENFDVSNKLNIKIIHSLVIVKKACAMANKDISILNEKKAKGIINACDSILTSKFDNEFVVDALQGGAGTSTNMNVNEVITNVALELLGYEKGRYDIIHPINDVNMSQSTNDTYPTAVRIAAIKELRKLADEYSKLQVSFQSKETEFSNIIKLGRTQLMDALPIMMGQVFGSYAKAVSRDRWRIYKVEERIRTINLGGTAIGTGLNAPRKYIFLVTDYLQKLTNLGLSRSEFMIDTTQNLDVFVEVSGLLKSAAVSLIKICNDLRLMASGPKGGFQEITLKEVQAGSSIMPGKVNPVILEMTIQTAINVISNDQAITQTASLGNFELNAFTPLLADKLLNSLETLTKAIKILREKSINDIKVNEKRCLENLLNSTSLATVLISHIGYDKASEIAKIALEKNKTIKEVLLEKDLLNEEEMEAILNIYAITSSGIPGK